MIYPFPISFPRLFFRHCDIFASRLIDIATYLYIQYNTTQYIQFQLPFDQDSEHEEDVCFYFIFVSGCLSPSYKFGILSDRMYRRGMDLFSLDPSFHLFCSFLSLPPSTKKREGGQGGSCLILFISSSSPLHLHLQNKHKIINVKQNHKFDIIHTIDNSPLGFFRPSYYLLILQCMHPSIHLSIYLPIYLSDTQ